MWSPPTSRAIAARSSVVAITDGFDAPYPALASAISNVKCFGTKIALHLSGRVIGRLRLRAIRMGVLHVLPSRTEIGQRIRSLSDPRHNVFAAIARGSG